MMWIAVLSSAGIAFVMRVTMLFAAGGRVLRPSVERALAAVGPAVIAAMLAASLMTVNDGRRVDSGQLVAVGAVLAVVAKTGNLLIGTAAGITVLAASGWLWLVDRNDLLVPTVAGSRLALPFLSRRQGASRAPPQKEQNQQKTEKEKGTVAQHNRASSVW